MNPPPVVSVVVRRAAGRPALERTRRLRWGLSARLPRWRAFDGRRSRVAINWTASTRPVLLPRGTRDDSS